MQQGSFNKAEEAFLASDAQDEDALLEALEQILPSETKRLPTATAAQPQEYIRQLDLIHSTVEDKLQAVNCFIIANWMHELWRVDQIPPERIARHTKVLNQKFERIRSNHRGFSSDSEAEKIKNGRTIFGETCKEVENLHTQGVPFVRDMNEGELHHKANNHEIGWHPDWEDR